ncbi:MAG TPA: c-type cytochrome [Lacunisphaera sp.]|nr:c-type cytochrome [Lacunisphaera sp.]
MLRPLRLFALLLPALIAATAAEVPPPWAYGFKVPPPPGTAQVPSGKAGAPSTDPTKYALPGTDRTFTRAEITDIFATADWYPGDHPAMPDIVAHGKAPVVWACTRCHYTNGKGRPENAGISGLAVEYFVEQMLAFRNGDRVSSDPRKPNTPMMADFARAITDDEIRAAAEYFGAIKWTPWIRVVETDRAPKTTLSAGMYLQVPEGGDEELGDRIIEVPEDANAVEIQRSPRVGFVAYAPVGSIKRGEELVTTGGGKTIMCVACHGPDLNGMTLANVGSMPGLAGRSPSYLVRQLFDIQTGKRRGPRVDLMKPVVANLTPEDMLAIAAYLASRTP